MSRQMIPYLIKFFSLEAHADQFIADNLFMNRLSHFRKLEGRDDSRSDANEAIAMWWQPHDIIVTCPRHWRHYHHKGSPLWLETMVNDLPTLGDHSGAHR
jgi:hypothetical protein